MTRLRGICCLGVTALAFGQPAIPKNNRYEVVSIKRAIQGQRSGYRPSPGEFRLDNYGLPGLISALLGMPLDRIIGLPAWISSETFSFRAKPIAPTNNPAEQWGMLIPVLEERFKLKYHREKRQMRVYELSTEPSGVQFPVTVPGSCKPIDPNNGASTAVRDAAKPPVAPEPPRNCGLFLLRPLPERGFKLSVKAITMAQLAQHLQRFVGRPVVDRTGLAKQFDIESLSFASDATTTGGIGSRPAVLFGDTRSQAAAEIASEMDALSGLPNIFAALKKVGLRLTSGKGAVEVLVIDQLERPVEN